MKNILSFFIKFPVSVNVLIVAIFLFGIMGILSMKSSFFPLVPPNIITVQITYPGSSPNEIEEGVVFKIEDNLRGLVGIDRVTSVSSERTLNSYEGWTNKFIFPPYDFSIADCMVTNFHTPKSTLLMMVSAFAGHDLIMKAYKEAVKEKYKFYSYGDAMLIL